MDQRSFQRLLRRTVALPVLLLMLLAAVLAGESLLLYASLHWVDHSDQVIGTARQLQRQIVEMETDLRGYYLTGDRAFLDSYNDAKSKVPDQLDSLQRLTSDNPAQQARLKVAREVDQRWLEWAARQMPGGRQSSPSAEELLKGQQLLDQTRQRQRDFVAAEESLRSQRSARAKALNAAVIGSAVGLSLLVAVLLLTITRRELMALSSTYEKHLQSEAQQLQQLKESREQMQITLKSLGEAVVSTDQTGKLVLHQSGGAAADWLGWVECRRDIRLVKSSASPMNRLTSRWMIRLRQCAGLRRLSVFQIAWCSPVAMADGIPSN